MKSKIEYVATADLIHYAKNSRAHSEMQVSQIAGSIREFGFTNPVLIDAENGIIAGHGRAFRHKFKGMQNHPSVEKVKGTSKHRYLMPLDAAMREQIAPLAKPYPKKITRTKEQDAGYPPALQ